MRRLLQGSILLTWIAFMAGATIGGAGEAQGGLLQHMQAMLMALPFAPLGFEAARAVLTGVVVSTLSITLWALMIAVTSDEDEHRERVMSMGAAFSFALAMSALWMALAAVTGFGAATGLLFAVQAATLLSILAAGGVEFAWEIRSLASAPRKETDSLSERVERHLAGSHVRLAAAAPLGEREAV